MADNRSNTKHLGYSGLKDQTISLIRKLRSIMYPDIFVECPCSAATVIESSVEAEQILREVIPWVMPDSDAIIGKKLKDQAFSNVAFIHTKCIMYGKIN